MKKFNTFYLVFMQYKCENNVIEQINESLNETSLTSNLKIFLKLMCI